MLLRRVRKEELKKDTWIKPDGLDECLSCWVDSMHRDDTDLGVRGQKMLSGDGDGYGNEDTGQARRNNEIAAATGAMIMSLRAHHRWAIHRITGITTVWNFPRLDMAATAQEAKSELEQKLKNNVVTRTLF